jgi:hypothetical protein
MCRSFLLGNSIHSWPLVVTTCSPSCYLHSERRVIMLCNSKCINFNPFWRYEDHSWAELLTCCWLSKHWIDYVGDTPMTTPMFLHIPRFHTYSLSTSPTITHIPTMQQRPQLIIHSIPSHPVEYCFPVCVPDWAVCWMLKRKKKKLSRYLCGFLCVTFIGTCRSKHVPYTLFNYMFMYSPSVL